MKRFIVSMLVGCALIACAVPVDAGVIRRRDGGIRGGRIARGIGGAARWAKERIGNVGRFVLPPYGRGCNSSGGSCDNGQCEMPSAPPAAPSAPPSAPPAP